MTDPQKWTEPPSPTQLRHFYAGTALSHISSAIRETKAAMEGRIIPSRKGWLILSALKEAEKFVERIGNPEDSQPTHVLPRDAA